MRFSTLTKGFLLLCTFVSLDFLGCTAQARTPILRASTPAIEEPTEYSVAYEELSLENIGNLQQVAMFDNPTGLSQVVKCSSYHNDPNIVIVAYEDGFILRWDVSKQNIINEIELDTELTSKSIGFDGTGEYAIIPSLEISENKKFTLGGPLFQDVRVVHLDSGETVSCGGKDCNPESGSLNIRSAGFIISWNGDVYSTYIGGLIDFTWIQDSNYLWHSLDIPDQDVFWHIGGILFDDLGESVIIAYEEKEVQIRSITGADAFYTSELKLAPRENTRFEVRDIKLDETQSWLAVVYEDETRIWKLEKPIYRPSIRLSENDYYVVEFDRKGDFLAIGSDNQISIFDLEQEKFVAEIEIGSKATSIFFSLDNRFLIVGTSTGGTFIYGVN